MELGVRARCAFCSPAGVELLDRTPFSVYLNIISENAEVWITYDRYYSS